MLDVNLSDPRELIAALDQEKAYVELETIVASAPGEPKQVVGCDDRSWRSRNPDASLRIALIVTERLDGVAGMSRDEVRMRELLRGLVARGMRGSVTLQRPKTVPNPKFVRIGLYVDQDDGRTIRDWHGNTQLVTVSVYRVDFDEMVERFDDDGRVLRARMRDGSLVEVLH